MIPLLRTSVILLSSILLPFTMTSSSTTPSPRTCYICYNCKTFEAASQARQCDEPDEQFCWVRIIILTIAAADQYFMLVKKEELETGEVNRLCATQEKCDSAPSNTVSTCCSGDRCNTSSTYSSLPTMAWVVVMALVRQTMIVI